MLEELGSSIQGDQTTLLMPPCKEKTSAQTPRHAVFTDIVGEREAHVQTNSSHCMRRYIHPL